MRRSVSSTVSRPKKSRKAARSPRWHRLELALIGIGRIESDPQEEKPRVVILPAGLGPTNPADGAVNAQAHGLRTPPDGIDVPEWGRIFPLFSRVMQTWLFTGLQTR
jgi:hypothetical protein